MMNAARVRNTTKPKGSEVERIRAMRNTMAHEEV